MLLLLTMVLEEAVLFYSYLEKVGVTRMKISFYQQSIERCMEEEEQWNRDLCKGRSVRCTGACPSFVNARAYVSPERHQSPKHRAPCRSFSLLARVAFTSLIFLFAEAVSTAALIRVPAKTSTRRTKGYPAIEPI
jgi:hypothetical protein